MERMTAKKVEEKGQSLIAAGKICMLIGLCALGLFLLIVLISFSINGTDGFSHVLEFDFEDYEFGIPFLILSYLGTLAGICGIPMYFSGLKLFALGRIAVNTEKNN